MNLRRRPSRRSYEIDMTNGPIFGKIIRFAIPLALSGILQLLFNAADIIVVGRFAGSNSLAAVGATGAVINLIINLFLGLSVGTNVLVARYYGAGRKKDLQETVHTSVLSSVIFGFILLVIGLLAADPMLRLMDTPAEVIDQASLYMRIYFIGMPVSMLYNFGSAVLRAVGDTKRPLYFLAMAGVVNVILNLILVIIFHLDVAGVAIATVVSQAISAALVVWCLMKVPGDYKLHIKQLGIKWDKLWGMTKIGVPAGVQSASFSISNILIQSSINSFGATAMAGNTAASNIEGFVSLGMDAFSQAALSFTAQNLGAGKIKRINKILIQCMLLITGTGLVMGVGGFLLGPQLLSIYSGDQEVIAFGMERMAIVCAFQFIGGWMGVFGGALRGMGSSTMPMIITIFWVCVFRVVWIFTIFAAVHTLPVLYVSYPVTWGLSALFEVFCFLYVKKKAEKRLKAQNAPCL